MLIRVKYNFMLRTIKHFIVLMDQIIKKKEVLKMKTFSKKEIIEDIIEYLENTGGVYGCDLHSEVFNTDYYIIGLTQAKKALESYGVFDALNKVQTYEIYEFGEVTTDLSDLEKLANMFYYIESEEYLYSLEGEISDIINEYWGDELEENEIKKLIELFKKELEQLK